MYPARTRRVLIPNLTALSVVLSLGLTNACADSCIWSGKEVGKSKNEQVVVTAELDEAAKQWTAVWHDTKADKKSSAWA